MRTKSQTFDLLDESGLNREASGVLVPSGWGDYELKDSGEGEKLERWKDIVTVRPDPQAIWPKAKGELWNEYNLRYSRSRTGGGGWDKPLGAVPDKWTVSYSLPDGKRMSFFVRPTDFKHMGIFPEQAVNWDTVYGLISGAGRQVRVLNVFGYTGCASVACMKAGAEVTHVDASKGMNRQAAENIGLNGLHDIKHRILTDDANKFIQREARRHSLYDAVIADPPAFGRGPSGEVWKLQDSLYGFVRTCVSLLSERPLFMLLNIYASGLSHLTAANVLMHACVSSGLEGRVYSGELGIAASSNGYVLPCGAYGRLHFI